MKKKYTYIGELLEENPNCQEWILEEVLDAMDIDEFTCEFIFSLANYAKEHDLMLRPIHLLENTLSVIKEKSLDR